MTIISRCRINQAPLYGSLVTHKIVLFPWQILLWKSSSSGCTLADCSLTQTANIPSWSRWSWKTSCSTSRLHVFPPQEHKVKTKWEVTVFVCTAIYRFLSVTAELHSVSLLFWKHLFWGKIKLHCNKSLFIRSVNKTQNYFI